MADYKALERAHGGHVLYGHGTELFTYGWSGVDTDGQDISASVDVKSYSILTNATEFKLTGEATGSAQITVKAASLEDVDCVAEANTTLCNVAAVSGTIDVILVAWR